MRKFVLLGVFSMAVVPIWAADSAAKAPVPTAPSVAPEEIIRKFAAKEAEFAEARSNYTYRQTVKLLELDPGGATGGKWELVEDIIFSPDGKRTSKVVYAPVVSLQHILLTPSDEQDLRDVQPFVLTTKEIPEYDIQYLGKQNADEIPCYNF